MDRINYIGYGKSCPLELIELTEAKRTDTIEADFLCSLLGTLKGKYILDLCAGTGRLSVELVKRKAFVFALDGSRSMAQLINKRKRQLPYYIRNNLTLIFGDACEIDYPSEIDATIITDGSIGYFYRNEDIKKTLQKIYKSLKGNGLLIVYLFNKNERMKKDKVNQDGWIRSDYSDENNNFSIIQFRRSRLEKTGDIVLTDYTNYYFSNGQPNKSIKQKMRYRFFSIEQIKFFAEKNGFVLKDIFGNYKMESISDTTDYVIVFYKEL